MIEEDFGLNDVREDVLTGEGYKYPGWSYEYEDSETPGQEPTGYVFIKKQIQQVFDFHKTELSPNLKESLYRLILDRMDDVF